MKKTLKIASMSILALTASTAGAEMQGTGAAVSAATTAATSSGSSEATTARAASAGTKTYCMLVEQSTGTRLKQRKCRTKLEWLNLGVDVTAKD